MSTPLKNCASLVGRRAFRSPQVSGVGPVEYKCTRGDVEGAQSGRSVVSHQLA